MSSSASASAEGWAASDSSFARTAFERMSRGWASSRPWLALAGRQHVAGTADGLEEARVARVGFDLVPQARDNDIDRAIEGLVGGAVQELEELLAIEDATGALREREEEPELEV